jgi:NAD(P)-dependent dehydrogenase (short-subunit alcohol dehydrogenase family)
MKTDLNGRTAIVTGGSKGYGAGIAEALKERGAEVWITGRDEASLSATAKRLDVRCVRAEVTSPEDWDRLFEEVLGESKSLDILVNNAGAGGRIAPVSEMTDEDILQSIAVNLTGALLGCRRAAKVMRTQRSGTIINISSVCQRQAWPGWSVYSAAKAGLGQFSNCLYTELREYGVRVTTVMPSWGATHFLEAAHLGERDEEEDGKCTQPRELGELVASICELPPHLGMQDVTLLPLIQQIEPL